MDELLPLGGPEGEAPEDPIAPFLDSLYRWVEAQAWGPGLLREAWVEFWPEEAGPRPEGPQPEDPDGHDRAWRFWAWACLDRPMAEAQRPIDRFLAELREDLSPEGLNAYEALAHTHYAAFKVSPAFRRPSLEPLMGGPRRVLAPSPIADELVAGDLVVGRVVPLPAGDWLDPDAHLGPMLEAPQEARVDAKLAERMYFANMVPAKGAAMDVVDALLMQVDSPLHADDLLEMMRGGDSMEAFEEGLYRQPSHRLRYLHLRDRSLLHELLTELWESAGPLPEAQLPPEEATALARFVRQALRTIASGTEEELRAIADPKGFIGLYLDLYGLAGLRKLAGVAASTPAAHLRTRHELLPRDGGILTTLQWGQGKDQWLSALVAHARPEGGWRLTDVALPEGAPPGLARAYESAAALGWASPPPDEVEARLRRAIEEVGHKVQDAVDLIRLWRDFKEEAQPSLEQPAIWAAGVELLDGRYHHEDVDLKALARHHGVLPRAIEAAADEIEAHYAQAAAEPS